MADQDSSSGLLVLVVLLVAIVVVGAIFFMNKGDTIAPDNDINIDLPEVTMPVVPDDSDNDSDTDTSS